MMKRSALLVAASLWIAASAQAGMIYDFVTTMVRPRTTEKVSGRMWIEGDFYRAEFERDGKRTILISRDGDQSAAILDPAKSTWSNRARVAGNSIRSAALFMWPTTGAEVKGKPKVTYRLDKSMDKKAAIAGESAVAHVIEATFRVESIVAGSPLKGKLRLKATIWTSPTLPELPMQKRRLRTGYDAVDVELEKAEQNIHGMVLRHELEVTRTFEGGPPETEKTTTEIVTLERTNVDDAFFTVPETYRYAGPKTQ